MDTARFGLNQLLLNSSSDGAFASYWSWGSNSGSISNSDADTCDTPASKSGFADGDIVRVRLDLDRQKVPMLSAAPSEVGDHAPCGAAFS